jgi:hypothetical protein
MSATEASTVAASTAVVTELLHAADSEETVNNVAHWSVREFMVHPASGVVLSCRAASVPHDVNSIPSPARARPLSPHGTPHGTTVPV